MEVDAVALDAGAAVPADVACAFRVQAQAGSRENLQGRLVHGVPLRRGQAGSAGVVRCSWSAAADDDTDPAPTRIGSDFDLRTR